jgi:hypothetical protein
MYQGKAISSLDSIKVREAVSRGAERWWYHAGGVMIDLDKFLKFDTLQSGSLEKLDLWLHEQVEGKFGHKQAQA